MLIMSVMFVIYIKFFIYDLHRHTPSCRAWQAGLVHATEHGLRFTPRQSQRLFPAPGPLRTAWVQGVTPASALGGPGVAEAALSLLADC